MIDLDAHARSRVGSVLRGKYQLDRLLGVGGMASVYDAAQIVVGSRAALKILHPHMSSNADIRARFLREGFVANQVGHRGAVRVLDSDASEDGSVFLVMELLEGQTLDEHAKQSGERLPVREVAELAHQLLDVLAAAHDKGIVHRDIKPENVFLTHDRVLKVLDFGIARLASASLPQGATRTGRMLGSPAFMAPEQALGRQRGIDERTDLWSVGATMFTLMTGQYAHHADTVEELLIFAGSKPARPLRSVAPEVPPAMALVVDRALSFEKVDRWESARTMSSVLEDAYLRMYGVAMPGTRPVPASGGPATWIRDTERALPIVNGQSSPVASTLDTTEIVRSPWSGQRSTGEAPARAASTTAGVSGAATSPLLLPTGPGLQPRRATLYAVIGVAIAVALGLGIRQWASTAKGSNGGVVSPPSSASLPATAAASTSAAPPEAMTIPLPVDAGPAIATPTVASGRAAPGLSLPKVTPMAPSRSKPSTAPRPSVPPQQAQCSPPTWIDAQGLVHLKQGCL